MFTYIGALNVVGATWLALLALLAEHLLLLLLRCFGLLSWGSLVGGCLFDFLDLASAFQIFIFFLLWLGLNGVFRSRHQDWIGVFERSRGWVDRLWQVA